MTNQTTFDHRIPTQKTWPYLSALARRIEAKTSTPVSGPAAQDLLADLFFAVYGSTSNHEEIPAHRQANLMVLEWFRQQDAWGAMTGKNKNLVSSIYSASAMWEQAMSQDFIKDLMDKQDELDYALDLIPPMPDPDADDFEESELDSGEDSEDEDEDEDQGSGQDGEDEPEGDQDGEQSGDDEDGDGQSGDGSDADSGDSEQDTDEDGDGQSGDGSDADSGDSEQDTDADGDDQADADGSDEEPQDGDQQSDQPDPQDGDQESAQDDGEQQEPPSPEQVMVDDIQAELSAMMAEASDELGSDFMKAVANAAVSDAKDEAIEMMASFAGWGSQLADPLKSDPTQAIKFAELNDGNLQKIAELAGRFRQVANTARQGVDNPYIGTPDGIEDSQDFPRMFATEVAQLVSEDPEMSLLASVRYAEDGLTSYVPSQEMDVNGPFVLYCDISASMGDGVEYGGMSLTRLQVAVAMGFALSQVAAEQDDRQYRMYHFSDARTDPEEYRQKRLAGEDVPRLDVSSGEDLIAHMEWAGIRRGGGTDFDFAITRAIQNIEEMEDGESRADLVFVSDDYCSVSEETAEAWQEFSERTGVRMIFISVAPVQNLYLGAGEVDIHDLCSTLVDMSDLSQDAIDKAIQAATLGAMR